MLIIRGRCVDITTERVNDPGMPGYDPTKGTFDSSTIHLLTGEGRHTTVQRVRAGRDFAHEAFPAKDEDVELQVFVTAYPSRAGAGFRLTSPGRVQVRAAKAA